MVLSKFAHFEKLCSADRFDLAGHTKQADEFAASTRNVSGELERKKQWSVPQMDDNLLLQMPSSLYSLFLLVSKFFPFMMLKNSARNDLTKDECVHLIYFNGGETLMEFVEFILNAELIRK